MKKEIIITIIIIILLITSFYFITGVITKYTGLVTGNTIKNIENNSCKNNINGSNCNKGG
ncbi:hypothetical protein J4218_04015 [Candidatus Pacearchaeota archaeon]|nr:hypothetical protein [Candidatus Pacearchaeota archaeon]